MCSILMVSKLKSMERGQERGQQVAKILTYSNYNHLYMLLMGHKLFLPFYFVNSNVHVYIMDIYNTWK